MLNRRIAASRPSRTAVSIASAAVSTMPFTASRSSGRKSDSTNSTQLTFGRALPMPRRSLGKSAVPRCSMRESSPLCPPLPARAEPERAEGKVQIVAHDEEIVLRRAPVLRERRAGLVHPGEGFDEGDRAAGDAPERDLRGTRRAPPR